MELYKDTIISSTITLNLTLFNPFEIFEVLSYLVNRITFKWKIKCFISKQSLARRQPAKIPLPFWLLARLSRLRFCSSQKFTSLPPLFAMSQNFGLRAVALALTCELRGLFFQPSQHPSNSPLAWLEPISTANFCRSANFCKASDGKRCMDL